MESVLSKLENAIVNDDEVSTILLVAEINENPPDNYFASFNPSKLI